MTTRKKIVVVSSMEQTLPVNTLQLDLTDGASIKNLIEKILSEAERTDVLIKNAGCVLGGAFKDFFYE